MVAYERVFKTVFDWETKRLFTKWSLTGGGRLREVVAYGRWSLTGGGRLREVVAYERWSLTGGGRLREVVAGRELTVLRSRVIHENEYIHKAKVC